MWLNHLFTDAPIDFKKRCKTRIWVGSFVIALGLIAILITIFAGGRLPVMYLEPGARQFLSSFYSSTGFALIGAGIILIWKNIRFLQSPGLRKKQETAETDERNRLLGLRCWAYSGYTMFLLLYLGVLASGFISLLVLKVLCVIAAVYGLLLLIFRLLLQRAM